MNLNKFKETIQLAGPASAPRAHAAIPLDQAQTAPPALLDSDGREEDHRVQVPAEARRVKALTAVSVEEAWLLQAAGVSGLGTPHAGSAPRSCCYLAFSLLSSCLSVIQGKQVSHDLHESGMDQTMQWAQCGGGKGQAPRGWN